MTTQEPKHHREIQLRLEELKKQRATLQEELDSELAEIVKLEQNTAERKKRIQEREKEQKT